MLTQPFLRREARKEMQVLRFCLSWSSVISSLPKAVPSVRDFFNWNLMIRKAGYLTVAFTSVTLLAMDSDSGMETGNLFILVRTLPKSFVRILAKDSEAISTSNCLKNFLMGFFSLLNFLRPS